MINRLIDLANLKGDIFKSYLNGTPILLSYQNIETQCTGEDQIMSTFVYLPATFATQAPSLVYNVTEEVGKFFLHFLCVFFGLLVIFCGKYIFF